ncbi:hypothetical protein RDI58_001181 [Solanum bulbocastanum]|uniref:Uncharacterized protein n=1 Tax=Solanum bulbocastanum TaxID=147425 RepID=A0AAN8UDJ6_SOLBU
MLRNKIIKTAYFDLVDSWEYNSNVWRIDVFNTTLEGVNDILPTENKKILLDVDSFTFENILASKRLTDQFSCSQVAKPDVSQSNVDDGTLLTFVDLKKDLERFKLHVDKKFGEILQAFGDLNKR